MIKILVINRAGYESQLRLYTEAFKERGYEVATASNRREALRLFEQEDFDLITLDLSIDTLTDGIEVLRLMKEKKPHIPIIMHTALDYKEDYQVRAADAYIVKSSNLTPLMDKARELTGAPKT